MICKDTYYENLEKAFFSHLSYSFGNEDHSVERRALNCKKADRVLCITASGDLPLHLLLHELSP